MIIECPNCGFSGKVPRRVANAPHHGRCPKCRFGFDISDLVARALDPSQPPPRDRWDGFAKVEPASSSSSYEIEALGDFWEDEEEPASPPSPPHPSPATRDPARLWVPRLFEGWAIALLVWAALLGLRAVYATLARADELVLSQGLFWTAAAVVLLVFGSACLFLGLDYGRKLADGHPAPPIAWTFATNRRAAKPGKRTQGPGIP